MHKNTERQLEEAYHNVIPYIRTQSELKEMCKHCEHYCGKEHNYEFCRDMMCFKFYLAFRYLEWSNNSDGY